MWRSSVFTLLVLTACLTDPDEVSVETQELIGCPLWGCSSNSPVMGPFEFHELDEAGTANNAGVRILGLVKSGVVYQPDVRGAHLVGLDSGGNIALHGTALAGAFFALWTPDGFYRLEIKHVSQSVTYWIGPQTLIETYELHYTKPGADSRPVCHNPPSRVDGEGQMWTEQFEAFLYTGDRYDADAKTVTASDYATAGTWFNIGCAGSALAKLHLNRHTTAGSLSTHYAYPSQRQAMLKMYVSDVCGDGKAYTKQGTPLAWDNTKGWGSIPASPTSYEAFWSASGAMCLDEHRLGPQTTADLQALCPKPTCSSIAGFPSWWPRPAYILTANP